MTTDQETIRILVIDDNPAIHDDIRKTLTRKESDLDLASAAADLFGDNPQLDLGPRFEIDSAYQGEEGFEMVRKALEEGRPYRLAFTDVRMPPGWDGIRTTERNFEVDPELQVVLCTAYTDYSVNDIVERYGQTDRLLILKKPFDIAEITLLATMLSEKWRLSREARALIANQSAQIVDLESVLVMVQDAHTKLEQSNTDLTSQSSELSSALQQRTAEVFQTREVAAFALAQLAESRDPETGDHLKRMQRFAQLIAERLAEEGPYAEEIDVKFLDSFLLSTPLHDIGKVGIPDEVLMKPGKLTPAEFDVMKRHTLIGARALEGAITENSGEFLSMAAEIALHHHERWDGRGYPVGLKGKEIPLAARIATVADVYDAITSSRVYKDAMAPEIAKNEIEECAGSQFDPVVVQAFLDCYDEIVASSEAINSGFDEAKELAMAP